MPVRAIPYPDEWNRILFHYGIIREKLKEDKIVKLSAILILVSEGGYVAFNHETGTATQGETVEASLTNLAEATQLYL